MKFINKYIAHFVIAFTLVLITMKLKVLFLRGSKVSKEQVEELKKALPKCEIEYIAID